MESDRREGERTQTADSQSETNQAQQSLDNPLLPLSPADAARQSGGGQQGQALSSEETSRSGVNNRSIQLMMEEMQRLREDFDTKIKYDESKQLLIDSLHKELQTYREGLHFKILRPIFMDLISMYDDLDKLLEDILSKENGISRQMLRSLKSFQESIEEILRRNGVEAFSVEGDAFVSGKQRVLKVVDTNDSALDKQVVRRVRKGFEYDGRILRPEMVEVYRAIA
jgi:molecular chaperone GrpE